MYVNNLCAFVVLSRVLVRNLPANLLARSLVHHVIIVVGSDGSGDDRFAPSCSFLLLQRAHTRTSTTILHFGLADIENEELCVCANDMDRPRRLYERCVARVSRCVPSLASCSLARCLMLLLNSPVLNRSLINGLYQLRSCE